MKEIMEKEENTVTLSELIKREKEMQKEIFFHFTSFFNLNINELPFPISLST